MGLGQERSFKGRHFACEVILWALRWYLAFPISYRDLSLMLSDSQKIEASSRVV
jgi:IS6 family transposase